MPGTASFLTDADVAKLRRNQTERTENRRRWATPRGPNLQLVQASTLTPDADGLYAGNIYTHDGTSWNQQSAIKIRMANGVTPNLGHYYQGYQTGGDGVFTVDLVDLTTGLPQYAYRTINCDGGTNPVAGLAADILTLTSNTIQFTITGDAPTDTVTFDWLGVNLFDDGSTISTRRNLDFRDGGNGIDFTVTDSPPDGQVTAAIDLTDFSLDTAVETDQVLLYRAPNYKRSVLPKNFGTVNCPSGTDPVADLLADTLNLTVNAACTDHLTIGGDSSTDTVDFNWNGVKIRKNSGAVVGIQRQLNFIEGSGVTLTITDDAVTPEMDITIAAAAGSYAPTDGEYVVMSLNGTLTDERVLAVTANELSLSDGGAGGNATLGIADDPIIPGTAKLRIPVGTTAQRPGTPADGDLRINTTDATTEIYRNSSWRDLEAGGSITVRKNGGADVGTRPRLNLHEGANCSLIVTDDGVDNEIDITIDAAAVFKTVNCPSGTDPVADTATDTLNLTATSGNLTITGNSGTDTVDFDWVGATVRKNSGADVGQRPRLNFIEGDNATLTISDDGVDNEIDITIDAAAVFKTVNCPSGTDPVADGSTDTLNLAASAGSNLTIVGDSSTDTATWDWQGLSVQAAGGAVGTYPKLNFLGGDAMMLTIGTDAANDRINVTTDWDLPHVILEDQKASGTNGGTLSSSGRQTRALNTEVLDSHGLCTLSSNQFTLAAGTWEILAFVPAYHVDRNQAFLYNVSDTADELSNPGKSCYSTSAAAGAQADCIISGRFTIAGTKTFEIQQDVETTYATYGAGVAGSFGTEVYTRVHLWRLAA